MSYQYNRSMILENAEIAHRVFLMKMARSSDAVIVPGQFYMFKLADSSPLLARPLSVCEVTEDTISFCYIVVGEGTDKLSKLQADDQIFTIGPLGNGFDPEQISGQVAIVAGGIGIVPFVELVKHIEPANVTIYAGFSTTPYLLDRFTSVKAVHLATDDGSYGHHGFVTDIFDPSQYNTVLTCGPEVLMEKIVRCCQEVNIPSFASMDKHMACGVGACLVCACKTINGNKRCCVDGPVFRGQDLVFE